MKWAVWLLLATVAALLVANPVFVVWFADPTHHTVTHIEVHAIFQVALLIAVYLGVDTLRREQT